tara:strand:- start:140 stop:754 length:615 start_codon:yes stop_codon:yes gene_type:complete
MVATVLAGCVSQTPEERLANMGPVYGPSTINYTVASDGAIDLDSAVDVAKTLGRYRRLNVDESETVRRLAQEKFDGFVIKEVRRLQPAYAAKKKEIKLYSQNLVASATPAETEKIRREEALSLDKLNDEIRSQAVIAVRRRYGSQIAVPLKTRDNKPVVAIAKIRGDKVSAPGTAIELDRKPGSVIQHQGQKTAVIGNQVTLDP